MIENIFSIPLYRQKLNIDNAKINNFITSLSKSSDGVMKSNVNGWQSEDISDADEMSEFLTSLDMHLLAFSALILLPIERKLDRVWGNVNKYSNYNLNHIHPGCLVSGVYYTKVPENSGAIYFNNPVGNDIGLSKFISNSLELRPFREYPSEEGELFLFPSWLDHGVLPNMNENEDRISISFNVN